VVNAKKMAKRVVAGLAYETPAGIVYGDDASGSWQSETVAAGSSSTFVSWS
jgi:hypothetical protein